MLNMSSYCNFTQQTSLTDLQNVTNKSMNIPGSINTAFLYRLEHISVSSVIFLCKKIKIAWGLWDNTPGSFLTFAWPGQVIATRVLGLDNIHNAVATVQAKNLFERPCALAKLPTMLSTSKRSHDSSGNRSLPHHGPSYSPNTLREFVDPASVADAYGCRHVLFAFTDRIEFVLQCVR